MSNTRHKKTAIIIGTGAGGGIMARELQGKYQVTVLEAGKEFKPFSLSVQRMANLRRSGIFFDERLIRLLLPNMLVEKSQEMVMVRGIGLGGTTTLATGNAVRYDGAIKDLGIDLDAQFEELYQELPITTDHQKYWTKTTKKMYNLFEKMGLDPIVTPKLLNAPKCVGCRRPGYAGHSGKLRHPLQQNLICRSGSLCGGSAAGTPSGQTAFNALYQPAGRLHPVSLYGLPQLFLQ